MRLDTRVGVLLLALVCGTARGNAQQPDPRNLVVMLEWRDHRGETHRGAGVILDQNAQGTLIDPARTLAVAGLTLADGVAAPGNAFQGRWSVIRPITGDCGPRERALLAELARVRLALDKDADRVQRVVVHDGGCVADTIASDEPGLRVFSADAGFLAQFPPSVDGAAGIYIADPHGNLMMSYPASGSARGLLKDLERLLRLSSIG